MGVIGLVKCVGKYVCCLLVKVVFCHGVEGAVKCVTIIFHAE
jgi:hypothetical protein